MIYKETIERMKAKSCIGIIIFNNEIIDEAFNIEGDIFKIFVRNKIKENLSHHRSFKLKGKGISKEYKYGIPIIFDKIIDENKMYHFTWDIDPDIYENASEKRKLIKMIGKKGSDFIEKALSIAGDDMIEYWKLNPNNSKENKRIDELEYKYREFKI